MSYILNALKHSENQRNRGEIPHIDSQPEFVKVQSGRWAERAWKWAALVAVAALLLSLGWARFGGERRDNQVGAPLPPSPSLAEPAAPAPVPQPAVTSPGMPALAEQSEQAPGLPALQDMAGVRIRLEDNAMSGAGAAAAATPVAPESPSVVLEMPVSAGVTPREAAPPPDAPAAGAAPSEEVLSGVSHWKTLPADIQKQLREMAFTAHIYSANPAARFVRVSGRTLHEGEQLGAELQLQQITRDGIVFTYRGEKFWIGMN